MEERRDEGGGEETSGTDTDTDTDTEAETESGREIGREREANFADDEGSEDETDM
jgi:hypothetical protein